MSDYYNNRKKKRSRREKIGFYTACSICLIAVCMAVYSTYNTLSVPSAKTPAATQSNEVKVNENVTGVTQTLFLPLRQPKDRQQIRQKVQKTHLKQCFQQI